MEKYEDAIKCYKEVLNIDSKDKHTWFNIGHAYRIINDYDKAIESFEKVCNIEPDNKEALVYLKKLKKKGTKRSNYRIIFLFKIYHLI